MVYAFIFFATLMALYYFFQPNRVNRVRKVEQRENRRGQHNEMIKKIVDSKKDPGGSIELPKKDASDR